MRIESLGKENKGDKVKVAARIIWEDCDRPVFELSYETPVEFDEGFSCNPHTFLVAALMPAFHFGEERISINEGICPELKDGLLTNMKWINSWFYGSLRKQPVIEEKGNYRFRPRAAKRAAVLFSGGIDSLATIRHNRLNYAPDHPKFIQDGILIYGLEIKSKASLDPVIDSVSRLARDAGVKLIPISSNIREIGPGDENDFWNFWADEFEAAAFASVAHLLSKRIDTLFIGSTFDVSNLICHASHPLIDPNFGSCEVQIRHDGVFMSRLEKTKLVADWPAARRYMRVCNRQELYKPGKLNCGRCEKCARTMLALLACGVLEETEAFSENDVSKDLIEEAVKLSPVSYPQYAELVQVLAKHGRTDLAVALQAQIAKFYASQRKKKRKETIKELDAKFLNSNLIRLKRAIYRPRMSHV